jgi:hypothetical protein
VLDRYAVGFRVMHGFSPKGLVREVAEDADGRDMVVLYVGDYDPSGLFMSECDLPQRLEKYEGHHVELRRVALTVLQASALPCFPASDKGPKAGSRGDPRYKWFIENHGDLCWEIDAMDPTDLRECVERQIEQLIEPTAWARCEAVNAAELASLQTILTNWRGQP